MKPVILIRLCLLGLAVGWAITDPSEASAQEDQTAVSFTVDEALASQGGQLFVQKGCMACHSVGEGRRAGPDLLGVIDRRELEWVKRFLTGTSEMLESDPVAQQLLEEYNYVRMPDLGLNDSEADALIHYIVQETLETQGDG